MGKISERLKRAKEGKIVTVPFIHPKLRKYIFIGKNMYHLIGGAGGSGKSSWVDYNYVLYVNNWYRNLKNPDFKIKIIVRSMERSKENRIAKWVCMKLYQKHGILIDTNSISGWNVDKSKIDSDLIELVAKEEDILQEELSNNVEVIDGIDHPTSIFLHLKKEALSKGKLYQYEKINGTETLFQSYKGKKIKVSPQICPEASLFQPVYIPDDPNEITIFIIDHLQAMKRERGFTDKENLDKMSEYARILRDLFGFTPVIVNQLNRGIADTYRKVKTDLLPQDSDFSGSSSMYQDADMAGILFNPYKYGLNKLADWDLKRCVDEFGINRFRSFHLLKNTYGPDNQMFGYQFIGENGIFNELPNQVSDYRPIAYPKHKQKITNYV